MNRHREIGHMMQPAGGDGATLPWIHFWNGEDLTGFDQGDIVPDRYGSADAIATTGSLSFINFDGYNCLTGWYLDVPLADLSIDVHGTDDMTIVAFATSIAQWGSPLTYDRLFTEGPLRLLVASNQWQIRQVNEATMIAYMDDTSANSQLHAHAFGRYNTTDGQLRVKGTGGVGTNSDVVNGLDVLTPAVTRTNLALVGGDKYSFVSAGVIGRKVTEQELIDFFNNPRQT